MSIYVLLWIIVLLLLVMAAPMLGLLLRPIVRGVCWVFVSLFLYWASKPSTVTVLVPRKDLEKRGRP